jgi:cytochrome c
MKSILWIAAIVGGLVFTGAASAQSGAELFKKKGCGNCHAAAEKKVGPSLKDLATKYKGNEGAVASVSAKLKDGKGHPKVAGSNAEIKAMTNYALGK